MKRKQLCSLITIALMATLVVPCNVKVQAKEKSNVVASSINASDVKCTYEPEINQTQTNAISGNVIVENTSGHEIDLSGMKLNYYFSNDNNVTEEFHCYYSGTINNVEGYQNFTDKISGRFIDNSDTSDKSKSRVCEMTISDGKLPAGEKIIIKMSFNSQGWTGMFDQSNDYSFNNKVVGVNGSSGGTIVNPPVEEQNPSVSLNVTSYKKGTSSVVKAPTENGNLSSIKENGKVLSSNDYRKSGANVIFKNTFLDSLNEGRHTFEFVFDNGKTVTKTLTIGKADTLKDKLGVIIPEVNANAGDTVDVPVKVKISKDTTAVGASVKISNTSEYTIVGVEDNDDELEKLGASSSFGNYISKTESALTYVIFDQGSFDGEYLLGTVKVKLNSNLAAGTKVKLNVSEVLFGDSSGKKLDVDLNVGTINIGGSTTQDPTKDDPTKIEGAMNLEVANVTGKVGEEVTVPVTLSDFKSGLYPIENYEFVTNYDSSKLEFVGVEGAGLTSKYSKLFLTKDASNGSVKVQYLTEKANQIIESDGVICNLKFKVKNNASGIAKIDLSDAALSYFDSKKGGAFNYDTNINAGSVSIDTSIKDPTQDPTKDDPTKIEGAMNLEVANVTGKVGEEVTVPVTLSDFKSGLYPIENYEFVTNYDSSKLEFVGVEGAGLTSKYSKLFLTKDASNGSVKVQYLTEKANQIIESDGVICNLKFKVKNNASGIAKIDLSDAALSYFDSKKGGAFNYDTNINAGSVSIDTSIKDPTQDPTKDDPTKIEGAMNLEVANVTGKVGEEVTVPVTLSDFKSGLYPIENYEFVTNYDSSKLEFVGVEGAGLTSKYSKLFLTKDASNGSVKIQYLTEKEKQSISDNGVICNLKFKIKSNGTAKINLSDVALSYYDEKSGDADNYKVNIKSGLVTAAGGDSESEPTKPVENKPLGVVIGDVTAKAGETVQIPVKVKISKSTPVVGASVKIKDTDEYSIVSVEDNDDELEELGASSSFGNYIAKSKTALMYLIFDQNSFDGEYLVGTVNVKLNSNLSSGTKVKLNLDEVLFGDSEGKALDYGINAGTINIK